MKLRKVLAFVLAAAMLLGLCAGCGKKPEEMYDEAMEAIQGGDAAKGEELLTKAAEKDYVPASAALGDMYSYGEGVEQDYAKAAEMYQKAADGGDGGSMLELGTMYYCGEGVEKDEAKAFELFTQAAELTSEACANLGILYWNGAGTEKDYGKAVECWTRGYEECDDGPYKIQCAECLGEAYYYGKGTEQSFEKAFELFTQAAEAGSAYAQEYVGRIYQFGYGVVDIDCAQAAEWYQKAADQGDAGGMVFLGDLYASGEGVEQDEARANELYGQALDTLTEAGEDARYDNGWFLLGYIYKNGLGVEEDADKAMEYFTSSAQIGDPDGMFDLARCYYEAGEYDKALELMNQCADMNMPEALVLLGVMYGRGEGVEQDYAKALELLTEAEALDDPYVCFYLADIYMYGLGVERVL